ncbi:MAG: helix-turn-helix domain-containing protein [Victivallales bacterium]|nr:helix-turn-helix domain-containing protein [Victivallales bacterium]
MLARDKVNGVLQVLRSVRDIGGLTDGEYEEVAAVLRAAPRIDPYEVLRTVSIKTAAEILEFSEPKVRNMLRDGELRKIAINSTTVRIPLADIRRYIDERIDYEKCAKVS